MAKETTKSDTRGVRTGGRKAAGREAGERRSKRPRQVTLTFEDHEAFDTVGDPIHKDLSAAARMGDALFLSCDETAGVDRLTPLPGGGIGDHRHYNLGEWIALPGGADGEMDIEGLDIDDGWLWIVGSHSLTRGKPDADDDPGEALRAMAKVKRQPNRAFLARVPLADEGDGLRPVAQDDERRLAHIKLFKRKSALKAWLDGDPHIGPFLDLPSKENGLDIEGSAAKGLRVWLGLRGPVLREMAVILELQLRVTKKGLLKAEKIEEGRRYRKHLVTTRGQGIRDMAFDGDDLLILTGTVMTGDGPSEVIRIRNMTALTASCVVPADRCEVVADMPYRGTVDHPEGLTHWTGEGEWLVVYDSPADARVKENPARVTADIFSF